MPRVERYRHGTPCWVDLATTDLAGAKAFYAGLFGWEYEDEQMGEMDIGVYSMAMLDGSAAAAIYESGPGRFVQTVQRSGTFTFRWRTSTPSSSGWQRTVGLCWRVQETLIARVGWR